MLENKEFTSRYAGRYFGKYRGFVSNNGDPKELGRLRLVVPSVLGNETETGWAFPMPASGGGENSGDLQIPERNEYVWVEFEEGDTARPLWAAGPWGMRNGESMVPKHSRGLGDDTDYVFRETENLPPSQFSGQYGHVRVMQNRSGGGFLEFDDTPGEERIQLSHRNGTRIEMTADGSMQEAVSGSSRRFVGAASNTVVGGNSTHEVKGSSSSRYGAARQEEFVGPVHQTFGELTQTAGAKRQHLQSSTQVVSGTWSVQCGGNGSMMFNGALAFMIQKNLQMTVLENAEIAVSNATGDPTKNAVLIQGYNGNTQLLATDATGNLIKSEILLKGNSALSNILIGGELANEPMVLGNLQKTWLETLIDLIVAHTHPTGMGPSGPPTEAPAFTATKETMVTFLSKVIMGKLS